MSTMSASLASPALRAAVSKQQQRRTSRVSTVTRADMSARRRSSDTTTPFAARSVQELSGRVGLALSTFSRFPSNVILAAKHTTR